MLSNHFCLAAALAVASLVGPIANAAPLSDYATLTSTVSPATVKPGGHAILTLHIAIAPDFHINANKPADAYAIPTLFTPSPLAGISFGTPKYPTAVKVTESYSLTPMLVYTKSANILVPITVTKATPGKLTVSGTLNFQGCNHQACFPPKTLLVSAALNVK